MVSTWRRFSPPKCQFCFYTERNEDVTLAQSVLILTLRFGARQA